jgi:hypothetical protein
MGGTCGTYGGEQQLCAGLLSQYCTFLLSVSLQHCSVLLPRCMWPWRSNRCASVGVGFLPAFRIHVASISLNYTRLLSPLLWWYQDSRKDTWTSTLPVWSQKLSPLPPRRCECSGPLHLGRSILPSQLRMSCHFMTRHSFIQYSSLRQVHSLFQSKFSTECDLLLPISIYNFVSLP